MYKLKRSITRLCVSGSLRIFIPNDSVVATSILCGYNSVVLIIYYELFSLELFTYPRPNFPEKLCTVKIKSSRFAVINTIYVERPEKFRSSTGFGPVTS